MGDLAEHFSRSEFACKCGCGFDVVDAELLEVLVDLRYAFGGRRLVVNSGCRCKHWNKECGGDSNSQHLLGKAADVWIEDVHADEVADYLLWKYPDTYGIGRYVGRTHIDVRSKMARWDLR